MKTPFKIKTVLPIIQIAARLALKRSNTAIIVKVVNLEKHGEQVRYFIECIRNVSTLWWVHKICFDTVYVRGEGTVKIEQFTTKIRMFSVPAY